MPTVGADCDFTLQHGDVNGGAAVGFYLASEKNGKAYQCRRDRLRSREYTAAGSLCYTDSGPGRREWRLVALARDGLVHYTGAAVGTMAETFRANLEAFYALVGQPIVFVDPAGVSHSAYFDGWLERMPDLPRTGWEIEMVLVEA